MGLNPWGSRTWKTDPYCFRKRMRAVESFMECMTPGGSKVREAGPAAELDAENAGPFVLACYHLLTRTPRERGAGSERSTDGRHIKSVKQTGAPPPPKNGP